MASKDLHNCAQFLSNLLEMDTAQRPVIKHGIQNKKPVCRTSKAFVTTGRLPRKIASSKPTKARPILALGKSKSSPGIIHKTEEDSLSLEFAASHADQKVSKNFKAEERTVRIPTADMESDKVSVERLDNAHMSPPASVLFNRRLASSTPIETPKKLVDLGNTLILNGSTKTQVLNSTDEVKTLRADVKAEPMPKLIRANINYISNPHISENCLLASSRSVKARTSYLSDPETNPHFALSIRNLGHIISPKRSSNTGFDVPIKDIGDRVSTCDVGVGNSVHSVGVGRSMHSVGVGNSQTTVNVENSFFNRSSQLLEKSLRNDNCDASLKETDIKTAKNSGDGLVQARRSGSMVDLSSFQGDDLSHSAHYSTSFNALQTPEPGTIEADLKTKDSTRYRSLMVGNGRCLSLGASGDPRMNDFSSKHSTSATELENSNTACLVALLTQVKDVVSEKQNCKISQLIGEIQDVILNTSPSKPFSPLNDIDKDLALQPLRIENSQLRRRVRILNQQLRDKDMQLEAVRKPDPSFQVLHLSMLNDHLENQLIQQKQETADLQEMNQKLQEENDKVVKEKADMLIMLAKKDDSHIKSLQDKMREIARVKADHEELRREKKSEVDRMNNTLRSMEMKIIHNDKEIEEAETLIRILQESMSQLVHDLQNSPFWPQMESHGNLSETMQKILNLTRSGTTELSCLEDQVATVIEVRKQSTENNLGASQILGNLLNHKAESLSHKFGANLHKLNSVRKISSDNGSNDFTSDEELSFANTKDAEELSHQAGWPSCGVTVKELMNPLVNYGVQQDRVQENTGTWSNNLISFQGSVHAEDEDFTLVPLLDRCNVTLPVAQDLTDMTHNSLANYFQEYCSVSADSQKQLNCGAAFSETSNRNSTHNQSVSRNSESQVDETLSARLSDFNKLADFRQNSPTETNLSDFNEDGRPVEWKSELKKSNELHLDLTSLNDWDANSTGTSSTLSSLSTISVLDEHAFKDSLASLDANIAQIQENLRRNLTLKFSKLSGVCDEFKNS